MNDRLGKGIAETPESDHIAESPMRFIFFSVACVIGFFALSGFGIYNFVGRRFLVAGLGLAVAFAFALVFVICLRVRRRDPLYFIGMLITSSFLIYLLFRGRDDVSLALWTFIIPVTAFLLLGKRQGLILIAISAVGIGAVFFPWGSGYEPIFKIRFAVTYLVIFGIALAYETVRARFAAEARDRYYALQDAAAEIARLSITDGLTGCYNRLYMDDRLHGELKKSIRYTMPISVVMCDIDHFKRINDEYGHQIGDEVLKALGDVLRNCVRDEVDWVARYGGEEFVLVLPNTPATGAEILAERIRKKVEELRVSGEEHEIKVTASFGVTEAKKPDETALTLLKRADDGLYEAKRRGRNRVMAA